MPRIRVGGFYFSRGFAALSRSLCALSASDKTVMLRRLSLTLFLRHHELTNENVSYLLINQSKTKTFTGLK